MEVYRLKAWQALNGNAALTEIDFTEEGWLLRHDSRHYRFVGKSAIVHLTDINNVYTRDEALKIAIDFMQGKGYVTSIDLDRCTSTTRPDNPPP